MKPISQTVFEVLGLGIGACPGKIQQAITEADIEAVPVFSDDGRNELLRILTEGSCEDVELVSHSDETQTWRYSVIEQDEQIIAEVLICPADGVNHVSAPPTKGELLILNAWCSGTIDVKALRGAALLKSRLVGLTVDARNVLLGIVNCSPLKPTSKTLVSFLAGKTKLELKGTSRILKSSYPGLLMEAISQKTLKWRFLQFYRIFEHGFLDTILERIKSDFLAGPKEALSQATQSLTSEGEQLMTLARSYSLENYFERIDDEIEQLKTANNKFAFAISRKLSRQKTNTSKLTKGVYTVYAIRCAIAHAGSMDIFYEKFEDADTALAELMPILEEAALSFLELTCF